MKSRVKQVFSLILALTLVLNVVPGLAVPAAAAETAGGTGSVVLSKTATLEADGTYTIDLSGFVTGQTTTTQYASNVPLDVILVLDASSSMLQYRNYPNTYEQKNVTITGWSNNAIPLYHPDTTNGTNLWTADLDMNKDTDMSRMSKYYSHEEGGFVGTSKTTPIRGSVMIPVKPYDKIYCNSFKASSITGGDQDGICVAYFDKAGNLLKSVSAEDVYKEFMKKSIVFRRQKK